MSSQSYLFNPTERTLAAAGDGFSAPRLTTADRLALSLGVNGKGMMVYDTTIGALCLWNGTAWEFVTDSTTGVFNVKDYGATGNGVTNDTTAIQATIAAAKAAGGGTVFFPLGTYRVVFPAGIPTYTNLFNIPSNVSVQFDEGALMSVSAATGASLFSAVFGADLTALPVKNIKFLNMRMIQDIPVAGQESSAAVQFATAPDAAADSITNALIQSCDFTSFACPVYIVQRVSVGTTTRQVRSVKITNCVGNLNPSFITADGADIDIDGNTAVGDATLALTTYDAVSIHSGSGIRIVNNNFSHYGQFGVNLRNSVENLCGSSNIAIANNTFSNCVLKAIGIYLVAGETVYGVKNISVTGNTISHSTAVNTCTAINVTSGGAGAGTPFETIAITGNTINGCQTSIEISCNTTVWLTNGVVTGNTVKMSTTNTGNALRVQAMQLSTFAGNTFYADNHGAAYVPFSINFLYNSSFSGNQLYTSSTASPSISFTNLYDTTVNGCSFYGKFAFTTLNNRCVVGENRFVQAGSCEGRNLAGTWYLAQGRIAYYGSSVVTGSWYVGDQVFDAAVAGGYIGKVCTTAGSPGTFKDFGAIVP
jgi:polygalacturonase